MTQGVTSLSNGSNKVRGPGMADHTRQRPLTGKPAPPGIKSASPPAVRSPTSPNGPSRPYVHCPYVTEMTIVSDADAVRQFERQVQLHNPKDALRVAASKDARRGPNGARSGAHSTPSSPLTVFCGASGTKKNVCRHYLEGTCNRGSACRFYHPGASHRVVAAPRTPTRRPLTPLADLLAQEQQDLALSSGYASPTALPHSAFTDAQRSTPPNDSGNTSFTLNPVASGGSFATPVLSPPGKPKHAAAPTGLTQLALPNGALSPNSSVDQANASITSPLAPVTRNVSAAVGPTKSSTGSPQMTFTRAPASPTTRQQHNPYAYAS